MKLSIIIPAYNAEPYINELIDCLEPQMNDDVEVIEDRKKIASRITGILLQAFNIRGAVQTSVLATAVKNYVCTITIINHIGKARECSTCSNFKLTPRIIDCV